MVLNIDRDHLDFFGDLEHIQEAFIKFANKATRTVIYNGDDANTVEAMAQVTGKKMITFSTGDHCDWQAKNIHVPGGFTPITMCTTMGSSFATQRFACPARTIFSILWLPLPLPMKAAPSRRIFAGG